MIDILNIEWPNSDRDAHISIPVLVYLEKKYQLKTKTVSIFNGYYYLIKYRPKIILISNFTGAEINYEITKNAFLSGIKVVALVSEGNRLEDGEFAFWGHNIDKFFYLDKMLVWSSRYYDFHLQRNKIVYDDKVKVVGGVGFDRYKLLSFKSKHDFLHENNFKFSKVIGIAAWAFDVFFGDYYKRYETHLNTIYTKEQINMHRNDLEYLRDIYKKLIENNPDILFILRYHPGSMNYEKTEFFNINFKNVFISNQQENTRYKISDLINISDIWIGYETTTAMEAWLLDKPTLLVNPTTSDFIREILYEGSPICKELNEIQQCIDEFYKDSVIRRFEDLIDKRDCIIKDSIEYSDGKNHIRAAEETIVVYNNPKRKIKLISLIYKETFKQLLKLFLSKTIFKNRWPHLKYNSDFAKPYKDMYDKAIHV